MGQRDQRASPEARSWLCCGSQRLGAAAVVEIEGVAAPRVTQRLTQGRPSRDATLHFGLMFAAQTTFAPLFDVVCNELTEGSGLAGEEPAASNLSAEPPDSCARAGSGQEPQSWTNWQRALV